ncbi:MAG: hypothetical protein Q9183_003757 [Haloplaca sp. 2 TL-2023]
MSRLDIGGTADSHPMAFAYLGPNTRNATSVEFMHRLLEDRDTFFTGHRKAIVEHYKSADDEGDGFSTDSEAEASSKQPPRPASIQKYGELMLSLDNLPDGIRNGWSVGRGYTKPGQCEDRDIDICLNVKHEISRSVSHAQAYFFFHEKSGVLCVEGVSTTNPLVYWVDGKEIRLFEGQSHVIMSQTNHLRFGNLELVLRIPDFDAKGYNALSNARNKAFSRLGLEHPNPRLFAIPQAEPFSRVGQILVHSGVAGGGFGWVQAGVDMTTGEPHAMKELRIDNRHTLSSLASEIEASLKFSDFRGLMQASEIRCQHGCKVTKPLLDHDRSAALAFCSHYPTKLVFVFPLAITDFHRHDWENAELSFIVIVLDDVLEGVQALHLADWMHLDLTLKNLLLMSTKMACGKVTDFGKAIHAEIDTNTCLCPPAYQAPEVNGNPYTNKVDCFNMGLVLCHIILPAEFAEILSFRNFMEDIRFHYRLEQALQRYGEKGPVQQSLAKIAEGLTAHEPDERYSIEQALMELPRWDEAQKLFKWRCGRTYATPKKTAGLVAQSISTGGSGDGGRKKKRPRQAKVVADARKTAVGQAEQKDEGGFEYPGELKHKKPTKVVFSISGKK